MPAPPTPVIIAADSIARSADVNTNTNAIRTLIGLLGPTFFASAICPAPLSTTQRDALGGLRAGSIIWNNTEGELQQWDGTKWDAVTGAVATDASLEGDGTDAAPLKWPGVRTDATLTGDGRAASVPGSQALSWPGAHTDGVFIDGSGLTGDPIILKSVRTGGKITGDGVNQDIVWEGADTDDDTLQGDGLGSSTAIRIKRVHIDDDTIEGGGSSATDQVRIKRVYTDDDTLEGTGKDSAGQIKLKRAYTDGDTLTGDGKDSTTPLKLRKVYVDDTLTGDGKDSATPLAVANPFTESDESRLDSLPWQIEQYDTPSTLLTTQGQQFVSGVFRIDSSITDVRTPSHPVFMWIDATAQQSAPRTGTHEAVVVLEVITEDQGSVLATVEKTVSAGSPTQPTIRFDTTRSLGTNISSFRVRWTYKTLATGTSISCSDVDIYLTALGGGTSTAPGGGGDDGGTTQTGTFLPVGTNLPATATAGLGDYFGLTAKDGLRDVGIYRLEEVDDEDATNRNLFTLSTSAVVGSGSVVGRDNRAPFTGTIEIKMQGAARHASLATYPGASFRTASGTFPISEFSNTAGGVIRDDDERIGMVAGMFYNVPLLSVVYIVPNGWIDYLSIRDDVQGLPATLYVRVGRNGDVRGYTRGGTVDAGGHTWRIYSYPFRIHPTITTSSQLGTSGQSVRPYRQDATFQTTGISTRDPSLYASNTEVTLWLDSAAAMPFNFGGLTRAWVPILRNVEVRDLLETLRGAARLDWSAVEGNALPSLPPTTNRSPGDTVDVFNDGSYKLNAPTGMSSTYTTSAWTPVRLGTGADPNYGFDLRTGSTTRGGTRPPGLPTSWVAMFNGTDGDLEIVTTTDTGDWESLVVGGVRHQLGRFAEGDGMFTYFLKDAGSIWRTSTIGFTLHVQQGTPFPSTTTHWSLYDSFVDARTGVPLDDLPESVRFAADSFDDPTWADAPTDITANPAVHISSNVPYTASNITTLNYAHSQTPPLTASNENVAVRVPVARSDTVPRYRLASGTSYHLSLDEFTPIRTTSAYIYYNIPDVTITAGMAVRVQLKTPGRLKQSALPALPSTKTPRRVTSLSEDGALEGEIVYLTADYNVNHVDITPAPFANTFLDGEGLGTRGFLRDDASGAGLGTSTGEFPALDYLSDTRMALLVGTATATKVVVNGVDHTAAKLSTQPTTVTDFPHAAKVDLYSVATLPAGDWDEVQVFAGATNLTPQSLRRKGYYRFVSNDWIALNELADPIDPHRDVALFGSQDEIGSENPKSITLAAGAPARVLAPFSGITRITFEYRASQTDTNRYVVEMPTPQAVGGNTPEVITVGASASSQRRYALSSASSSDDSVARFRTEIVQSADRITASSLTRFIDIQFADARWANGLTDTRPGKVNASILRALVASFDRVHALPDRPTDGMTVNLLESDTRAGGGVLTAAAVAGNFVGFSGTSGSLTGATANGITELGAYINPSISALADRLGVRTPSTSKLPSKLILNDSEIGLTRLGSPNQQYFRSAANLAWRITPGAHYRIQIEFADGTKLYPDTTYAAGIWTFRGSQWVKWIAPTEAAIDERIASWAREGNTDRVPLAKHQFWFGTDAAYAALGSAVNTSDLIYFRRPS